MAEESEKKAPEDNSKDEAEAASAIVVEAIATDVATRPATRIAVHERPPLRYDEFVSANQAQETRASAHQPLTVLLPRMSTVASLEHFQEALQARSKQLQNDSERGQRDKMSEESMLNQVLQWLQISGNAKK